VEYKKRIKEGNNTYQKANEIAGVLGDDPREKGHFVVKTLGCPDD